jgi:hypothetical protein
VLEVIFYSLNAYALAAARPLHRLHALVRQAVLVLSGIMTRGNKLHLISFVLNLGNTRGHKYLTNYMNVTRVVTGLETKSHPKQMFHYNLFAQNYA